MTVPEGLLVLIAPVIAIVAILRLYRLAMDPQTRLRDTEGREIDPSELEDDDPDADRSALAWAVRLPGA